MLKKIQIGVVVFPGSNCDQDMIDALTIYENVTVFKLWHKSEDLNNADLIILPGGFSYGDYLRSGAIARFSPIMNAVIEFVAKGGFVFGVCNGFQILCESKLLPGALLHNSNHQFICKNTFIKAEGNFTPITQSLEIEKAYKIPIAHGEGRFYADDETLNELNANNQVIFKYCSENGETSSEFNPNGAAENIAGVCNATKNVFGMMPHPERAASSLLRNTDGKDIIEGLLKNLFL
jgi:phosphoribosylformylglycinamidine synthase